MMRQSGRLANKTALITGAASDLGLSLTAAFAREGARIVMTDTEDQISNEIAQERAAECNAIAAIDHDVRSETAWQRAIAFAEQQFGAVDILVNNAKEYASGSIEACTVSDWNRLADINAKGVFLGCKSVQPSMNKQGGGSIINVLSGLGAVATESCIAYSASEGAAATFTRSAMADFAQYNIRINAVMPHWRDNHDPYFSRRANLTERSPQQGTLGKDLQRQMAEVASTVVFLASDAASYINGVEWMIDGGWSSSRSIAS